jgi:8-oxo-dGTP pyrophosphatase MutT (NUDIX family)
MVRRAMERRAPSEPLPASGPRANPSFSSSSSRPAAVLCAVFEEDSLARVVLTRRSSQLRSHTGEVSFPGGRLDDGEAPLAAALREATEEIGLDPAGVEILGQLSPCWTVVSRSFITPFVGALRGRPALQPNPDEVERAFDVSLAELAGDGVYRAELWELPGAGWREMHLFELAEDTVWGATARMLQELLDLIFEGLGAG